MKLSPSRNRLPSQRDGRRNRAVRGFTLIELVIGLTLMALLSSMVFGIVRSSVQAAGEMQRQQQDEDQLNRFIYLCRQTFQSLPSTAILTLNITQAADPPQQELEIANAPEAFPFGTTPISYKDTILGMRPDQAAMDASDNKEPIYYLALSRQDLIPTDPNSNGMLSRSDGQGVAAPDDQGRFWMPLLPGISSVYWRFYRVDDDSWQDQWTSTTLPQLIEANLTMVGRTTPIRVVFSLPLTKMTGPNKALAPPPTAVAGGGAAPARGGAAGAAGRNGKGGQGPGNRGQGRGEGKGQGRGQGRGGPNRGGGGENRGGGPGGGQGGRGGGGGGGGGGGAPGGGGGGGRAA